ncbi:hypothetical protein TWF730_007272 [Orbilia blumenaviensis]|uniref:Uncharacterized protein n=1 Tax=Orbilia blumenaviensis TaxID=1796055 RepID=A0AAV9V7D6_9PEZI
MSQPKRPENVPPKPPYQKRDSPPDEAYSSSSRVDSSPEKTRGITAGEQRAPERQTSRAPPTSSSYDADYNTYVRASHSPVASILPWDEEIFYDIAYGRHAGVMPPDPYAAPAKTTSPKKAEKDGPNQPKEGSK